MCERERDYLEVIRRGLKTERKMVRKRKKERSIDKDFEEKKTKKKK